MFGLPFIPPSFYLKEEQSFGHDLCSIFVLEPFADHNVARAQQIVIRASPNGSRDRGGSQEEGPGKRKISTGPQQSLGYTLQVLQEGRVTEISVSNMKNKVK